MTAQEVRTRVTQVILARLDTDNTRRAEALGDFMALSLPGLEDKEAEALSRLVPQLPRELYIKWINLFSDRLLETIPQNQLDELCNGAPDNDAALGLVYLMFMESARMEEQVARDLAELGLAASNTDAEADALALYLKAKLQQKKGPGHANM